MPAQKTAAPDPEQEDIDSLTTHEFLSRVEQQAHEYLTDQHERTLDFIAKRQANGSEMRRLVAENRLLKASLAAAEGAQRASQRCEETLLVDEDVFAENDGKKLSLTMPASPATRDTSHSAAKEVVTAEDRHSLQSRKGNHFTILDVWQEAKSSSINQSDWGDSSKNMTGAEARSAFHNSSKSQTNELEGPKPGKRISIMPAQIFQDVLVTTSCCKHIVVHPYSSQRTSWDIVSLCLVMYDLVMIPLGFFELPENAFLTFMAWTTRIYWTTDMPVSFLSGFVTSDGSIELRPGPIARRYIRTWFLLDCLVVGIDWLEIIAAAAAQGLGFTRMTKASRVFRVLRLIRLLRLARMRETLGLLIERLDSEKIVILIDVAKLMIIMIAAGHLLACMWYAVAQMDSSTSWVIVYKYDEKPFGMKYLMALRWAISQFAGGMDEVTPENFPENIYGILVFLLAYWSGAVFLGILTSSMTQFYLLGSQNAQHLTTLRRYLSQNGISKTLALRVHRNAQHALIEAQRSLPESAVQLVTMVSEPLRVEIHYEMYAPILGSHPFFARFMEEAPPVARRVCHSAMSQVSVSEGDIIFNLGETPLKPKVFIAQSGTLAYTVLSGESSEVGTGKWIAEAPLWTRWVHRGFLRADTDARLYTVDATDFQSTVVQFKHMAHSLYEYAQEFVEFMNMRDEGEINDLTSGLQVSEEPSPRISAYRTDHGAGFHEHAAQASAIDSADNGEPAEFTDGVPNWYVEAEPSKNLLILRTSGRLFEEECKQQCRHIGQNARKRLDELRELTEEALAAEAQAMEAETHLPLPSSRNVHTGSPRIYGSRQLSLSSPMPDNGRCGLLRQSGVNGAHHPSTRDKPSLGN